MQLAAQPTDERGQAPARFDQSARGDSRLAREDVRVRALQRVERHFEPQVQQATRRLEVVVGGSWEQMDVGGVGANERQHLAIEGRLVEPEAQADAADQFVVRLQQFGHRHRGEAGIGGGEGVGVRCGWQGRAARWVRAPQVLPSRRRVSRRKGGSLGRYFGIVG